MARNTITVNILANTRRLAAGIRSATQQLGGLQRIGEGIQNSSRGALKATAGLAVASIGAVAGTAAVLTALPAAFLAIGIKAAASSKEVKSAWGDTADHIKERFSKSVEPLIPVLVKGAEHARKAFDAIAPAFDEIYKAAAPLLDTVFKQLEPMAKTLGPALVSGFKAGAPVFEAFVKGLGSVVKGFGGFIENLSAASKPASEFMTTLMNFIGDLLPIIGKLLASLAPLGATFASILLPAVTKVAGFIVDNLNPALLKLNSFIKGNQDAFLIIVGALIAFASALRIAAIAQGILNVVMALNPVGLVVAGILLLAGALIYAYQKSETFREIVQGVWNWLKASAAPVFQGLSEFIKASLDAIQAFWNEHGSSIIAYVTQFFGFVKGIIEGAMQYIQGIIQIWTGLISGDWGKVWQGIKNVFGGIWKAISNYVQLIWLQIKGFFNTYLLFISTLWGNIWRGIKSVAQSIWNGIKSFINGAITAVKGYITTNLNTIKSVWNGAWNAVKSFLSSAWSGIKNIVTTAINNLVSTVRTVKSRVTGALSGAGSWLYNAGRQVIQGLVSGIKAMAGQAVSAAKGVVQGAINGAKSLLGINSPSRVFMEIGRYTTKGLELGLEKTNGVRKASINLARTVGNNFRPELELGPAVAGAGVGNAGITINVTAGVGDPVEIGRKVEGYLKAYQRQNGVR